MYIMSSLLLVLNAFYIVSFLVEGKKIVDFFTFFHQMTPPTLASVQVNFLMTLSMTTSPPRRNHDTCFVVLLFLNFSGSFC